MDILKFKQFSIYLNNFWHFILIYYSVAIHIIHSRKEKKCTFKMENLLSLKSKKYVSTYIHLSIFAKKIQNVFYFFPLRLPWTNSRQDGFKNNSNYSTWRPIKVFPLEYRLKLHRLPLETLWNQLCRFYQHQRYGIHFDKIFPHPPLGKTFYTCQ